MRPDLKFDLLKSFRKNVNKCSCFIRMNVSSEFRFTNDFMDSGLSRKVYKTAAPVTYF